MSTLCIIPARLQSSRFPGKLLQRIHGVSILERTFQNATCCKDLDCVYIATGDLEIKTHAESFGAQVLWTTNKPNDGTERIVEALKSYPILQKADYILNVQGDHPCLSPETMTQVIQLLKNNPKAVLSTAVAPIQNAEEWRSPHIVKCVFDQLGNALYFSRSSIPFCADVKEQFGYAHIGIYCYNSSFLKTLPLQQITPLQTKENLEQLRILEWGHQIKVALVGEHPPSVDVPEDIEKIKTYLQSQ